MRFRRIGDGIDLVSGFESMELESVVSEILGRDRLSRIFVASTVAELEGFLERGELPANQIDAVPEEMRGRTVLNVYYRYPSSREYFYNHSYVVHL